MNQNKQFTKSKFDLNPQYSNYYIYKNIKIHYWYKNDNKKITAVYFTPMQTFSSLYAQFLEQLSQTYNVLCIDLIGHGLSEFIEQEEYQKEYFIDSVFQVFKSLQLRNYFFIGSAFGTQMCFYMKQLCREYLNTQPSKIIIFGPGGLYNTMSFNFWVNGTKRFYRIITKQAFIRVLKQDLIDRVVEHINDPELNTFCHQQLDLYLKQENAQKYCKMGVFMLRQFDFDQCFDLWVNNDNCNTIVYGISQDPYVDTSKSFQWLHQNCKEIKKEIIQAECREICLSDPQRAVNLIIKQIGS